MWGERSVFREEKKNTIGKKAGGSNLCKWRKASGERGGKNVTAQGGLEKKGIPASRMRPCRMQKRERGEIFG